MSALKHPGTVADLPLEAREGQRPDTVRTPGNPAFAELQPHTPWEQQPSFLALTSEVIVPGGKTEYGM